MLKNEKKLAKVAKSLNTTLAVSATFASISNNKMNFLFHLVFNIYSEFNAIFDKKSESVLAFLIASILLDLFECKNTDNMHF